MYRIFAYNAAVDTRYSLLIEKEETAWITYYGMKFFCRGTQNFLRLTNEKTGEMLDFYGDRRDLDFFANE